MAGIVRWCNGLFGLEKPTNQSIGMGNRDYDGKKEVNVILGSLKLCKQVKGVPKFELFL